MIEAHGFTATSLIEFLAGERRFEFTITGTGIVVGKVDYAVAGGEVIVITGHDGFVCVSDITAIRELPDG